jgi:hypothetical protein
MASTVNRYIETRRSLAAPHGTTIIAGDGARHAILINELAELVAQNAKGDVLDALLLARALACDLVDAVKQKAKEQENAPTTASYRRRQQQEQDR